MDSQDRSDTDAPLDGRLGDAADSSQIAEASAAIWQEIEAALAPIVGPRGVAALYKRSIHLTRAAHPWMAVLHEGFEQPMDTTALKALLALQRPAQARAAGNALLQTFRDLLASLVGPLLTERLLRAAWTHSPGDAPAMETQS